MGSVGSVFRFLYIVQYYRAVLIQVAKEHLKELPKNAKMTWKSYRSVVGTTSASTCEIAPCL